MSRLSRGVLAALVASLVLMSAVAPALAASDFNENASSAQNPYIATDVTVSGYDRAEMQPGQYENDSGGISTLPATMNQSEDVDDLGTGHVNIYKFKATDIEFSDAGAFPHDTEGVSAVDNETEWATDVSDSAGSMTVSDAETAPNVEAVEVSTSAQTSGDTAVATFDNFSVTSDAEKRYLQAFADVPTLDSGAEVQLRAVDSDGDYVEARINSSATPSNEDVIGSGTGEGYVYQRQIGSMSVMGSGDGRISEIQSIEVHVVDGDATVRFSGLNAEKTGMYSLGDERVDTDDEDDFETETIHEVSTPGDVMIYDLGTMGTTFDSAVIHGLTFPAEFRASDLEQDDSMVNVTFGEASSYPSFEWMLDANYRLELPSAYDLSYANAELKQDVSVPGSRYETVEYSEGVSDTDFDDIDSWTGAAGSFDAEGDTVTLDDTIQPGQSIAIHEVVLVTADEKSALQNVGGAGQFASGGDGGLWDMILSPFGAIAAALGGLLARARGSN
ncbi:hypothetical protein ACOZ4L_02690 [Haloplanus ruber]|uniref:PGF-CTERM sorting domain-containing protein n=1 Tax=Haloplanus ruber TaxID=869892 RepID=A0ABD6CZX5_9EURY|nr:hypothetical protein [Haloplanus ruber]